MAAVEWDGGMVGWWDGGTVTVREAEGLDRHGAGHPGHVVGDVRGEDVREEVVEQVGVVELPETVVEVGERVLVALLDQHRDPAPG